MEGAADQRAQDSAADYNGRLKVNNMDEMEDILNGEEQPVEAVEPQQEPKATEQPQEAEQAPDGQPRDAEGKFAPKGEESAPPAEEDKAAKGQLAAVKAEREKRQAIEQQFADLQAQVQQMQQAQQPKEPEAPPPSLWEDDKAWGDNLKNDAVSTAVQQATLNAKLDMSEMMARQGHDDFDDMKAAFLEMAQSNPALQQQALNDPHPWDRAYKIAKNAKTMEELGATDIEGLKAQLLEQLKAEQAQVAPAPQPNIPRSLADAQSSRSNQNNQAASEEFSLENILGN